MTTKRCTHCGVEQPVERFDKDRNRPDGLYPTCKGCRAEAMRVRRLQDPDGARLRAREAMRRWREKPANAAKGRENVARWRAEHPQEKVAYAHEYNLRPHIQRGLKDKYTRAKYGLTLDEYDHLYSALLEAQQGRCAACGEVPTGKEPLHLDHHHVTGRIRALLCGNCNRALGILQEDPARIAALLAYVKSHC